MHQYIHTYTSKDQAHGLSRMKKEKASGAPQEREGERKGVSIIYFVDVRIQNSSVQRASKA